MADGPITRREELEKEILELSMLFGMARRVGSRTPLRDEEAVERLWRAAANELVDELVQEGFIDLDEMKAIVARARAAREAQKET